MGQRQPLFQSSNPRLVAGALLMAAGAFCLILHWVGLGLISYDVFVRHAPVGVDLVVRAFLVGLVFAVGLGLGVASQRQFGSPIFPVFAQLYLWLYVLGMGITYLAAIWRLSEQNYTWTLFAKFLVIIGSEVAAIAVLRLLSPMRQRAWLAAPILLVAFLHLLVLVYAYVFAATPVSLALAGDLFVLVVMLAVSAFLLGENIFRSWAREGGAHG